MKDEISTIKNDQTIMKDEISTIKNDQGTMKQELKSINGTLDVIYEQVAKNAENITELKMDTKSIKEVQKRQERTIDLLSRRSLDQEAEIKRIK